jgi:hypothetical protein
MRTPGKKTIGITIIVAIISVACNSGTGYIETAKWTNFISEDGRFKIEFPQKPNEATKVAKTKLGEIILHYYSYDASTDDDNKDNIFVYYVSYADYPESIVDSNDIEFISHLLRDETEGMANSLHGKLEHLTTERIMNYPGESSEITFNLDDKQIVCKQKCFLVKNRMYRILVHTVAAEGLNKSAEHFFSAFQLI